MHRQSATCRVAAESAASSPEPACRAARRKSRQRRLAAHQTVCSPPDRASLGPRPWLAGTTPLGSRPGRRWNHVPAAAEPSISAAGADRPAPRRRLACCAGRTTSASSASTSQLLRPRSQLRAGQRPRSWCLPFRLHHKAVRWCLLHRWRGWPGCRTAQRGLSKRKNTGCGLRV